MQAGGQRFARK